MSKKGQEPAFPCETYESKPRSGLAPPILVKKGGMSKRYWTAVQIAKGMSGSNHHRAYINDICDDYELTEDQAIAKISFQVADALLEQEDK